MEAILECWAEFLSKPIAMKRPIVAFVLMVKSRLRARAEFREEPSLRVSGGSD